MATSIQNIKLSSIKLSAEGENEYFDPRQSLELEAAFVESIDRTNGPLEPIIVVKVGDTYSVRNGRTRVRACAEVNKLRAKEKRPLISEVKAVVESALEGDASILDALERNVRVDADPMTLAEQIGWAFSNGIEAEQLAGKLPGVNTVKAVNDVFSLLDIESAEVKKHIRSGKIGLAAALALVDFSRRESAGKSATLAQKMADAASLGVKVSKADVEKAKGAKGTTRLTPAQTVKLIEVVKALPLSGPHADAVKAALVLAFEVTLDARLAETLGEEAARLAKK